MTYQTNQIQVSDWSMTNATTTIPQPIQLVTAVPPPKPSRVERLRSGVKREMAAMGKVVDDMAHALDGQPRPSLPPMSGASPEAETTKRVEHKKTVVLERKVGVVRDKGSGDQEVHKGKLTMVRTMEGTDLQKDTIGLKTEPNSGTFVEIPVDKLREALDELDPPKQP